MECLALIGSRWCSQGWSTGTSPEISTTLAWAHLTTEFPPQYVKLLYCYQNFSAVTVTIFSSYCNGKNDGGSDLLQFCAEGMGCFQCVQRKMLKPCRPENWLRCVQRIQLRKVMYLLIYHLSQMKLSDILECRILNILHTATGMLIIRQTQTRMLIHSHKYENPTPR